MNSKLVYGNVAILIALLLTTELVFRWLGYEPGNLTPSWSNFIEVDTLVEYHQFYTNDEGIVVANKASFDTQKIAVNKQGFRTSDFETLDTTKDSYLFIGDSYTWGLSANPLDSCFVDLVLNATKNNVINLGVPVADPVQYAFLAKKYIPLLHPKSVFVLLYLGNDILLYDRKLIPNKPLYFYTNAGALEAKDGGRVFETANEAYTYFLKQKYFINTPKNMIEQIVKKSAMLSLLYSFKYRLAEKHRYEKALGDMSYTKKQLYEIASICENEKCELKIVVIPELKEADQSHYFFAKKYKSLFEDTQLKGLVYLPSDNSSLNYMPYPDAHLNNAGHAFYAKEILRLIDRN